MQLFFRFAMSAAEEGDPTAISRSAARTELGTKTIKYTVNEALRPAAAKREQRTAAALDVLAEANLEGREESRR